MQYALRIFWKVALLMSCLQAHAAAPAPEQWNPASTFVLVASITQWPAQAGLKPFTGEKRRDDDLVAQFKASGVPAANLIYLKDSAATGAGMRDSLRALAGRAGPGSTLVFYFQGHGGRNRLSCYDTDKDRRKQTEFRVDEIIPILDPVWRGDRLFLIGDCCGSGSLASIVRQYEQHRPGVRAACLASATASNVSTEHWTFTAALIRILAGDPLVDRDGDGRIGLGEAAAFLHDQMKYKENQLAGIALTPSFEKDFVVSELAPGAKPPAKIPGPNQIGDIRQARDFQGNWYTAEILAWNGGDGTYRVHFSGWDDKWDEWVAASRLRPIARAKPLVIGQQYDVQWQDKHWYLGTITKTVEDWFYFVHYEGEAGDDDEWVTSERTRPPTAATAIQRPEFAALVTPHELSIGAIVAAQWKSAWYRARITEVRDGTYAVRYDDETSGRVALPGLVPVARLNELLVGDRVLACWDGQPRMYPGWVGAVSGQNVIVRWEDGTAPTQVPVNAVARIKP